MAYDTSEVELYYQNGSSPDPANDDLLDEDLTIDPSTGAWDLSNVDVSAYGNGKHIVYVLARDLAGNASNTYAFYVWWYDPPIYIGITHEVQIGQMNNATIGETVP